MVEVRRSKSLLDQHYKAEAEANILALSPIWGQTVDLLELDSKAETLSLAEILDPRLKPSCGQSFQTSGFEEAETYAKRGLDAR